MPHQCVRCKSLYEEGASEIIKGCDCGSKLFFFIKKEKYDELISKDDVVGVEELSKKDRNQIELDIYEILGKEIDRNLPVILDIESVNIPKPGKFELDLAHLFNKRQPLVYRLEEGKYVIDITHSMRKPERKR